MAKVKVKKQNTFIDMTAMSDVTVLLLTFFMLTSTFIQKEPIQVNTPASVSEFTNPKATHAFRHSTDCIIPIQNSHL
ncbi:hypothetical protein EZS27_036268 [termite gut metagenome]|uniref:Biopolymer transport protein ExbD n=1 Tax=termite gut metagenome TaxID=433724 RepID=A0A5J4PW03_9ZZZZ